MGRAVTNGHVVPIASGEFRVVELVRSASQRLHEIGAIVPQAFLHRLHDVLFVDLPVVRGAQALAKLPVGFKRIPATRLHQLYAVETPVDQGHQRCQSSALAISVPRWSFRSCLFNARYKLSCVDSLPQYKVRSNRAFNDLGQQWVKSE